MLLLYRCLVEVYCTSFLYFFFYAEISNVKSAGKNTGKGYYMRNGNNPQVERIYVPMELQKEVSLPFFVLVMIFNVFGSPTLDGDLILNFVPEAGKLI